MIKIKLKQHLNRKVSHKNDRSGIDEIYYKRDLFGVLEMLEITKPCSKGCNTFLRNHGSAKRDATKALEDSTREQRRSLLEALGL